MGLTMIVWVYMYAKRIPFIQANKLTDEQLQPAVFTQLQPPDVSNPSDNLKNLFEMPVLFYAVVVILFVTNGVDQLYVWLAWGFALLRVAHSAVHCTVNHVLTRFGLYAASSLCLWIMIARAGLQAFSTTTI